MYFCTSIDISAPICIFNQTVIHCGVKSMAMDIFNIFGYEFTHTSFLISIDLHVCSILFYIQTYVQ